MRKFKYPDIEDLFKAYPEPFQTELLKLRELIFDTAEQLPEVGPIEEDLRWGEPSYLTLESKSGSAIRMDWKKKEPNQFCLYFNCKTTLISSFKKKYGPKLRYGGNRSLIFFKGESLPINILRDCIKQALTYNLKK